MSSRFSATSRWDLEWRVPSVLAKLQSQVKEITERASTTALAVSDTTDKKITKDGEEENNAPVSVTPPALEGLGSMNSPPADAVKALLGPTSVDEGPTVATSCPTNYLLNPYKIHKWVLSKREAEDFSRDDVYINTVIRLQKQKAGEEVNEADTDDRDSLYPAADEAGKDGDTDSVDALEPSGGRQAGVKRKEFSSNKVNDHDGEQLEVGAVDSATPAKKLKSGHGTSVLEDRDVKPSKKTATRGDGTGDGKNVRAAQEDDEEDEEIRIEDSNEGNEVESLQIQEIGAVDNEEGNDDGEDGSGSESAFEENIEDDQNYDLEEDGEADVDNEAEDSSDSN